MILKKAQVQNPALYRTFTLQKQRMEGERRSKEQGLFLGIPRGKCQHINETGFCHFQKGGKNHFFLIMLICILCVLTYRNNSVLTIFKIPDEAAV